MTVTKKLVAVVDDDASARNALSALVKAFGFVVAAFSSGAAFLASAELRNTACLIADMQMPDMSGLELFLTLLESSLPIPTILITAYPEDTVKRRALQAGVIDFLAKPVDSEKLMACLRRAVGAPPEKTQGT
jgi:FixJ family two-component response regulator